MRHLHETTRKRICRGAFFALCVAPTCAVIAWGVRWHLPGQAAVRAESVGRPLHARATLAGWREPKPGVVRIASGQLADVLSGAGLATVTGVEARTIGGVHVLSASSVTIDAANVALLAQRLEEALLTGDGGSRELRIGEILVTCGEASSKIAGFVARVDRDMGSFKIQAVAHGGGGKEAASDAIRVAVERFGDETGGSRIQITLDSTGSSLPAALLEGIAPGFAGFGPRAAFSGSLTAMFRDGALAESRAKGRLADVEFAAVLPVGSPHAVQGVATVDLEEAHWQEGRIVRVAGRVHADKFEASRSLVAAATSDLYCVAAPAGPGGGPGEMAAVDELAATFVLDEKGLTLWGVCPTNDATPAGCLATRGGRPLLMQPPYVELQCGLWVQFLAGPARVSMPATREAVEAARRLPLPRGMTTK